MTEKSKKEHRTRLKKELLAASIVVLSGVGQKSEARTAEAPETRMEIYAAPSENKETDATYVMETAGNDERYVYDRRLSKGLSNKFEGAYVNIDTREVLLKYTDPYKEPYTTTIKSCIEAQKLCVGAYDRSQDKEIRRELIKNRGNGKKNVVKDVVHNLKDIIRSRRAR